MKNLPRLLAIVFLAVAVAFGAWQGARVRHLREAERFYRWILAQATQVRLFAHDPDDSERQRLDFALYNDIVEAAEAVLPEMPIGDDDYYNDGTPFSKLTIAARDEQYNDLVFKLAAGDALAKQREDFVRFSSERRISSVASEFDPGAIYIEGADVSLSNIFFGFRQVAANFVWLRVDKYWHQGMEQRMIPLMRLCTSLDPAFVDAFLLGAWHLSYNMTARMPDTPEPLKVWDEKYQARVGDKELYYYIAIDFLQDGIRKNPRNYKLYFDLGYAIYNQKMSDYDNAVKYLAEAVRYPHEIWVPRMLNVSLEEAGQYERALAGWQAFLERNPGHHTAETFIVRNKGRINEQKANEMAQLTKDTEDPQRRAQIMEEVEELREEAIAIYESMSEYEEDPFAVGRIMKIKADRLIEEELYLEAAAVLQNARWKSSQLWDEATEMMIQAKLDGGIPLDLSEKKYVLRQEEAEKYRQEARNMRPGSVQ